MKKIISCIFVLSFVFLLTGCKRNYEYDNFKLYTAGNTEVSNISNLDISWISGDVILQYYDGNKIVVSETADEELSVKKQLQWLVQGNTLNIKFAKPDKYKVLSRLDKTLTVLIPATSINMNIEIEVLNANLSIDKLTANHFEIETESGDVTLGNIKVDELSIDSKSGQVLIDNLFSNELNIETESGKIDISMREHLANEIEIESKTANVHLRICDQGFILKFSSRRGKFYNPDFSTIYTHTNKSHVYKNGGSFIEMESRRGSLYLYKLV